MRALLALDSFKGALGAAAAVDAVAAGLLAANPDLLLTRSPLSDGGEGFVSVLAATRPTSLHTCRVSGPRGGEVEATFALVEAGDLDPPTLAALHLAAADLGGRPLAIIEMAQAAGLEQVPAGDRDPWQASTYGVGQLLAEAARAGAGAVLVGLGGSATQDLGLGALTALGLTGLDADGGELGPLAPCSWPRLAAFRGHPCLPGNPLIRLACDVIHPLLGPHGATATFGPQKGLPAADVARMDALAGQAAHLLLAHLGGSTGTLTEPGAGAAGGLGWGLRVGLGSGAPAQVQLVSGFDLVGAWLNLATQVAHADFVITGEGRFDATSLGGKGPGRLVQLAGELGKPVWVLAGCVADDLAGLLPAHLIRERIIALTPPGEPLASALPQTAARLKAAGRTVARANANP